MNIENANTLKAKKTLLSLIQKVNGEYTPEHLNYWLILSLGTNVFGAWIAYEKEQPIGMIVCEVVEPHDPKVYIAFNYVKPGVSVNDKLLEKVENWAKEKGIHKLIFYTKKSPNTFVKKFGWNLVHSILDKGI